MSIRWSLKFGRHLQILNVPGREYTLIRPANEALRELKGCMAPVRLLTSAGKGMKILMGLVGSALDRHEKVFITIKSKPYESA